MYKAGLTGLVVGLCCASLAGCQLLPKLSGVSDKAALPRLSAATIEVLKSPLPAGMAVLDCSGGLGCEFAQLNHTVVISETTRQPTNEAIQAAMVRFAEPGSSTSQAVRYKIAVRPGRNEVKLRFYPITPDRAENFSLIHDFQANKTYHLNMFRQRTTHSAASVLSAATPEPLCVDLLENDTLLRRFCRPFDPATGLGEFIEQRLASPKS